MIQLRCLRMIGDDVHDVFDADYPPDSSDEEYTLEQIATDLDYSLPIPEGCFPPKCPNLDELLHIADWIKNIPNRH